MSADGVRDLRVGPYQYRHLDTPDAFRVLRLYRRRTQHLHGELIHARLNTAIDYSAISYVWGPVDAASSLSISLDGVSKTVSKSLHEALSRCCPTATEYVDLWADQICINQESNDERSLQVSLMGKIYEQAVKTIVWLGDGDEQTAAAFALLTKLCKLDEYRTLITALVECTPVEALQHAQVVVDAAKVEAELGHGIAGVLVVLGRAWFSRLWTVQEVVVAKTQLFYCGQDSCSLADIVALATLAEYYERSCWQVRNMVRSTKIIWKYAIDYRQQRRSPLWTLLDAFSQTLYVCSEQHDRIYALLALQPSSGEPEHCAIVVDYQLPVVKMLQQVTEAIIKCTKSLDVLQSRGTQLLAGLPHWSPSWSAATGISRIRRNYMPFTASRAYRHEWKDSTDGVLPVRGRKLAKVRDTTVLMVSSARDEDLKGFLKTDIMIPWYEAILSQKDQIGVGSHFLNLLARTLTCGWAETDEPARHEKTTEAQLIALIDKLGGRSALHRCHQRRLAVLDSVAMVALVPAETQINDLICIVHGSTTPLVLRRKAQRYEYIGACFVEGMMYGETVTWSEENAETLELV